MEDEIDIYKNLHITIFIIIFMVMACMIYFIVIPVFNSDEFQYIRDDTKLQDETFISYDYSEYDILYNNYNIISTNNIYYLPLQDFDTNTFKSNTTYKCVNAKHKDITIHLHNPYRIINTTQVLCRSIEEVI
jgi:hypothetical protein